MRTARIIGTGSYLPSKVITNAQLYELIKDSDWNLKEGGGKIRKNGYDPNGMTAEEIFDVYVQQVTGIQQRNYFNGVMSGDFDDDKEFIGDTENMAAKAAKTAIKDAGIEPQDIDYIIASSFTPSHDIPNLGLSVAHLIGAENIGGITINTACSGFIDGLIMAYSEIGMGLSETILVVASETMTRRTNFNDRTTTLLFGDGAGAAILRASDTGIMGVYRGGKYLHKHIHADYGGFIKMEGGPKVLEKAVRAMQMAGKNAIIDAQKRGGYSITLDDVKFTIPHQANARIITNLAKKMGLSEDDVCNTITKLGNTSGSTVAIALDKVLKGEVKNSDIKRGDTLLLTAVGGGYTYASIVMKY